MKTKALNSFAVTAKLICVFVFAYAKSRFSHVEAQLVLPKNNALYIADVILDKASILLQNKTHLQESYNENIFFLLLAFC